MRKQIAVQIATKTHSFKAITEVARQTILAELKSIVLEESREVFCTSCQTPFTNKHNQYYLCENFHCKEYLNDWNNMHSNITSSLKVSSEEKAKIRNKRYNSQRHIKQRRIDRREQEKLLKSNEGHVNEPNLDFYTENVKGLLDIYDESKNQESNTIETIEPNKSKIPESDYCQLWEE